MSFLLAITILLTLPCAVLAEGVSTKIVISMDSAPAQVGDTITVRVALKELAVKKFLAADVALYYNPTVLKCISEPMISDTLTESEKMIQIYQNVDEKKGLLRCAVGISAEKFSSGPMEVSNEELELYTVSFEVIGQGDMNLQVAEKDVSPVYINNFPEGAMIYLDDSSQPVVYSHEKVSHVIGEKGDALISEILPIDAITVPYGTEDITAYLPTTVSVRLDDGSVKDFGMSWSGYMSSYDGNTPGLYLFRGTLQEEEGYRNHLGLYSLLEVTVLPEEEAPGQDLPEQDLPEQDLPDLHPDQDLPELPPKQDSPQVVFTDLDSVPWAADKIIALATEGIVSGMGDGIYSPNGDVTRAQFVTMLTRAFGLLDETAVCEFSDVAEGEWYYAAVASAKKHGITAGYEDNTFRPDALITRQEMAAMAYRTAGIAGLTIPDTTDKLIFFDEAQIADYAKDAITAMQMGGVINGMGDGLFGPLEKATRAQAAVIIYQLYQLK